MSARRAHGFPKSPIRRELHLGTLSRCRGRGRGRRRRRRRRISLIAIDRACVVVPHDHVFHLTLDVADRPDLMLAGLILIRHCAGAASPVARESGVSLSRSPCELPCQKRSGPTSSTKPHLCNTDLSSLRTKGELRGGSPEGTLPIIATSSASRSNARDPMRPSSSTTRPQGRR